MLSRRSNLLGNPITYKNMNTCKACGHEHKEEDGTCSCGCTANKK